MTRLAAVIWMVAILGAAAAPVMAPAVRAAESHGLSAFGDLKYAPDFKQFAYVDPDAPKGGRLALVGTGGRITFDSFNGYILKGDPAQGLDLLFDSLMVRADDEPDAVYGLVARSADVAADRSGVTFRLRPEAKFADGSSVTAEDVVFSFEVLKEKGHPSFRSSMRDVVSADAPDPHTVRFKFQGALTRDLPLVVATLPIFSKAYYAPPRDFATSTLEPPLGSGPYKIGEFKQGSYVTYVRRPDYWAKDLPVARGRNNFDAVRFEYFRDRTAALESLKAGAFDLREEFTAKEWSTAYNIPQVHDGRMVLLTMPDERPSGTQGFFLNTRKPKLADVRVRRALNLAFDFEWTNKNLFYNLYKRTESYFENSTMKPSGKPEGAELALLAPFQAQLPPEVFDAPFVSPVSDGSGTDRRLLRDAGRLLDAAGWVVKDGRRTRNGEVLDLEFLIAEPSFERILQPYVKNLQAIGVQASIRRVDPSQYERRVKSFDFDVVTQRYVMRLTPGIELYNYVSSESAKTEGSFNLAGIADPAVDALIQKVVGAGSRAELVTAAKALDRVLRAGHYWVPHWYKAAHNIAMWDRFGRPANKPNYADGVIDTWWAKTPVAAATVRP